MDKRRYDIEIQDLPEPQRRGRFTVAVTVRVARSYEPILRFAASSEHDAFKKVAERIDEAAALVVIFGPKPEDEAPSVGGES